MPEEDLIRRFFPGPEVRAPLPDEAASPRFATFEGTEETLAQPLPDLQPIPAADRAALVRAAELRASAWLADDEAMSAGGPAFAGAERWGDAIGLDPEARTRILDWAELAARSHGKPVLEVGVGEGRLLRELCERGVRTVGLELTTPMVRLARACGAAAARERDAAAERARAEAPPVLSWWAGDAPPAAPPRPKTRPPAIAQGDAHAPPFRDGSFAAVIVADVLCELADWVETTKRLAALLAPGGVLIVASVAAKDQDEPGFLSALGRELLPGVITGYPRSQDVSWLAASAGLEVVSASVFRVRRLHEQLGEREEEVAPGARERARALVGAASESLRGLYDIDTEGMAWRYMTVKAQKRRST